MIRMGPGWEMTWEGTLAEAEVLVADIQKRFATEKQKLLTDGELKKLSLWVSVGWATLDSNSAYRVMNLRLNMAKVLLDHAYALERKTGTRWSKDLPTEPGWYWYASVGQKVPHLCEITAHPADGRLIVDWGWDGWNLSSVEYGGVWAKAELPETPK